MENKIPDVSGLVKETNYYTKICELEKKLTDHSHDKYITTRELNTLAAKVFNARLASENVITKTDFHAKMASLNKTIIWNKPKLLLIENKLKKVKTFGSSYFSGKSHFEEDSTQNYLVFQPIYRYFKRAVNFDYILEWKSKGLSDESIKYPSAPYGFLNSSLNYLGTETRVRFSGSCLKRS